MADGLTRRFLSRFLPSTSANGSSQALAPAPPQPEQKSMVQTDFLSVGGVGRVFYLDGSGNGEADHVSRSTAYAAAIYCYIAMRYRAEKVMEAPLVVMEETADGDKILLDHPLNALLADPSPDYDLGELIELTQTFWDIDGDALWVKDSNMLGVVGRLTPFPGSAYEVRQTKDRIFGRFELRTAQGMKPKTPEQVVYFRYPNPNSRQRGLSPTDAALAWANLGQRTRATVSNWLRQAVFPSVIIQPHQDWNPDEEEYQKFVDALEQYHGGPENAGKPLVALGGGNVARTAFSLSDLLPTELLDRVEATTAAAYRLPAVVLGFLAGIKNSPWSQMEQAHKQAYVDCIAPLWKRIGRAATRQLLRPLDPDPTHKLAFDTSAIAALQDDESKKVIDSTNARHWTLDERRLWSGQDPIGGERGAWIEAIDSPKLSLADMGKALRPAIDVKAPTAPPPDGRAARWLRFDVMTKAQEPTWERQVGALLRKDRAAVLQAFDSQVVQAEIEGLVPQKAAGLPDVKATRRSLVNRLVAGLDPSHWRETVEGLVDSTGRAALKGVATEIGISFDLLDPYLLDYVEREAGWLVKEIDGSTRQRVADEISAGLANGEGIPELRKRLEDSPGFSRTRAELVARTEVTRVTNGAQRESLSGYQQTEGVVVEKSWLSAGDSLVREEHAALDDGSWIGIDETFANGLSEPGEPNCRCSLGYRIVDA